MTIDLFLIFLYDDLVSHLYQDGYFDSEYLQLIIALEKLYKQTK